MNVALAAIAVSRGNLYPPADNSGVERAMEGPLTQVVVTSIGHWRGEGLALVEAALKENCMPSNHDSAGRPIVVVTGMGVVTSLGAGKAENWKNLTAGKSGIKNITRFATEGLKTRFAGTVDFVPAEPLSSPELSERLADLAADEAVAESGIGQRGDFPGPLFIAVPPIEIEWEQRRQVATASGANANVSYGDLIRTAAAGKFIPFHERFMFGSVANHLADKFGTKGSPISLSTACASGATAIQLGVEAIRRGETSAALCIGSDGSINPESLIRFSLLSALSTSVDPPEQAAKPFAKNRDGFVMAEGAGALVLESLESAKARGAKILGVMNGCGEMADAFHRTRSSPDGKPIIGCIRNALADAGLKPDDIDYVNPHGTGTPENDKMEAMGVMAVFGERAKTLPMSSNKSMVGHTLSAAGAVEAVFSLLTLQASAHPADHQLPGARSRRSRWTWCRTRRATPRSVTSSPIRSASADRTSRWSWGANRRDRHHPRAARCSATASLNWHRSLPRRRPRPARCRSRSRRSRSTTSTSGAFAAWPSPSARCRLWSAPKPRARSPRSATA